MKGVVGQKVGRGTIYSTRKEGDCEEEFKRASSKTYVVGVGVEIWSSTYIEGGRACDMGRDQEKGKLEV